MIYHSIIYFGQPGLHSVNPQCAFAHWRDLRLIFLLLRRTLRVQTHTEGSLSVMEKLQDEGELKTYTLRARTDIGRRKG